MINSEEQAYKDMWNKRYNEAGYAYGKEPNLFFKEWLQKFEPGTILMPADGEGRNGVFAATAGWQVTSFDLSKGGKEKAFELAAEYGVDIEYFIGDIKKHRFKTESFDAIGLIYAHFPADRKSEIHQALDQYLKPGGVIILEAFSKNHLDFNRRNPEVGGPVDIDMLFSEEEILTDFKGYEILILKEQVISLNEGKYHNGDGAVIRFAGRKLFK